MQQPETPPSQKMAYTVVEAAKLLSLSRSQIYRVMDLGLLETIKVGRARRVTHAQLERFVRKLEQEHPSQHS